MSANSGTADGATDEAALRAASPALQEWWPDGESPPRSWKGVEWSDGRVRELKLSRCKLEALPPEIGQLQALARLDLMFCDKLKALPPEIGQLQALTELDLSYCEKLEALPAEIGQLQALTTLALHSCRKLTLAPGAERGQPAATTVAVYARFLIVETHKHTPEQLHDFLLANPLEVPSFFKNVLSYADHADWLGAAVKATPSLARLTAPDGRRAIDVAVPTCKQAMQAALFLLGRFDVDDGPLLHRSATAAVAAAADHTDPKARPVPRVALKAMCKVEQVLAELEGRVGLAPEHVVAVNAVYADAAAVGDVAWQQLMEAADELGIKAELELTTGLSGLIQVHLFPSRQEMDQPSAAAAPGSGPELKRQLSVRTLDASSEYNFLIVLELADRILKHTIDHEHIAGKDFLTIRHIAEHLAKGLNNVHAKGGIHADFKPLNVVGNGDMWKLIDFDVSCKLGEAFGNKIPSSGYCPPEMARECCSPPPSKPRAR